MISTILLEISLRALHHPSCRRHVCDCWQCFIIPVQKYTTNFLVAAGLCEAKVWAAAICSWSCCSEEMHSHTSAILCLQVAERGAWLACIWEIQVRSSTTAGPAHVFDVNGFMLIWGSSWLPLLGTVLSKRIFRKTELNLMNFSADNFCTYFCSRLSFFCLQCLSPASDFC